MVNPFQQQPQKKLGSLNGSPNDPSGGTGWMSGQNPGSELTPFEQSGGLAPGQWTGLGGAGSSALPGQNDPSNGTGWNSGQDPWSQGSTNLGSLGTGSSNLPPGVSGTMGGMAPTGTSGLPYSSNGPSQAPSGQSANPAGLDQNGVVGDWGTGGGLAPGQINGLSNPAGVKQAYGYGQAAEGTAWRGGDDVSTFLPGEPSPGSFGGDLGAAGNSGVAGGLSPINQGSLGGINPNTSGSGGGTPYSPTGPLHLAGFDDTNLNSGQYGGDKYTANAAAFAGAIQGLPSTTAGLQEAIKRLQSQGINAKLVGGDKIDFGDGRGPVDGIKDVGGQNASWWFNNGGGPAPGSAPPPTTRTPGVDGLYGGGGGWSGLGMVGGGLPGNTGINGAGAYGNGGVNLPPPPQLNQLQAPGPFTYQQSNLGQFQGPAAYQAPGQFSYNGGVPTAPNLQYQQQQNPQTLNYQEYNGLTKEQLEADPSYKFRFDQGANAASNILAHSGALRTGNAAKALTDYGQGAASQEYAAADARARQNVQGNNANAYQFGNANINNQFQATQANNSNAYQFGNQNFQNAMAAQGQGYGQAANTYGLNASTQMGAQAQNFNQSLAGYQANLGAQNQNYNQALGAYQTNANTGLQYGTQNQNNALANYQAQVNAQLGLGNLNLGFQNANQNYALGQGNLALGYQNSNNSYNLGMGNLNLAQNGQQFNQGLQTFQQNYQTQVLDPWNMNYQLAQLGNPGAPNGQANANAQTDLITGAGNAGAAGQIGAGNAWAGWWNNLGQLATQAYANGGTRS